MKKLTSKLILSLVIVLFFFSSLTVQNVKAGMLVPYPIEPNNDPPIITIETPTNKTYHTQNNLLIFTITKPDSWTWSEGTVEVTFDRILEINYSLDGKKEIIYFILDNNFTDIGIDRLPKVSPQLVELVNMSKGEHTLEIEVISEHEYKPTSDLYTSHRVNYKTTTSNPVIFNHATNTPTPTATSTATLLTPIFSDLNLFIIGSAVIIVGVGILAYVKKYKK